MIRRPALLGSLLLVAASCGGAGGDGRAEEGQGPAELIASVASYDLATDVDGRFIVGLQTAGNRLVAGGQVLMRFAFLGETQAEGAPQPMGEATATFLPLPDSAAPASGPMEVEPAESRGVYAVPEMSFDRAGIWQVEVEVDFGQGDVRTATAAFTVLPEHQVPAPGDRAPRTENLTIDSQDAPPEAIDSRAQGGAEVPDPSLHRTTIADGIEADRPVLAVFATPVYCVSKFCGPVTDMVQDLAERYGDRAEFVHVEIWRDFQNLVVNRAAAEWLLHDGELLEPWVFAIGADGRVEHRWDNVATPEEIEPWLERLP